jgi:hypothetical protein
VKKILLAAMAATLLSGCILIDDAAWEDCEDCYGDDGHVYTPPPSDEPIRARPR